jgi:hypothetical protein
MAGFWNEGSWGQGNFGDQNSNTVYLTSVVDAPLAWSSGNFGSNYWSGTFPYIGLTLGDETSAGEINSGWGRGPWSSGAWGISGTLLLTGQQINLSLNSVTPVGEINSGWGRLGWGINAWGIDGTLILNGNSLEIGIGGPAYGWGDLSWNNPGIMWGGVSTVIAAIGQEINVTGSQLNLSINGVEAFGLAFAYPTGQQINIAEGDVDASPDAIITGQQLNISLDSVTITAEINSGWGRRGWGIYDWGSDGISEIVQVSNTGLGLNINSGITEYWGQDAWGASTTEWGGSSVTQVSIDVTVEVNSTIDAGWGQVAWGTQNWGQGELSINLDIAEGEVDPSPDATVTGIGMTVSLAIGTVVIGTGNVTLTGQQLNIAQGNVESIPNTLASVTGIGLNIAVGTVFAGGNTDVNVTGNLLTVTLNSINNQIWTEINTGTDATWIEIDTAA